MDSYEFVKKGNDLIKSKPEHTLDQETLLFIWDYLCSYGPGTDEEFDNKLFEQLSKEN